MSTQNERNSLVKIFSFLFRITFPLTSQWLCSESSCYSIFCDTLLVVRSLFSIYALLKCSKPPQRGATVYFSSSRGTVPLLLYMLSCSVLAAPQAAISAQDR